VAVWLLVPTLLVAVAVLVIRLEQDVVPTAEMQVVMVVLELMAAAAAAADSYLAELVQPQVFLVLQLLVH
jgi:hypothetical protein